MFKHCCIVNNTGTQDIIIFASRYGTLYFEDCYVEEDQFDNIPEEFISYMINTENIGLEKFINSIEFLQTGQCDSEYMLKITPEKMNQNSKKLYYAASYPLFVLEES